MIARRNNKKMLIINADDLGLSTGTNQGIEEAFQKGILTSASLMVTTPAFNHALKIIKNNPKFGIGIHLSLTWGKSILPPKEIPDLVDKDGYFYPSFFRLLSKRSISFKKQVEKELYAQMEKAIKSEIKPDHINSQIHVHMIPWIFQIIKKLAKDYNIKYIRFSEENFFLIPHFPELLTPFVNLNLIKFLLIKMLSKYNHLKSPVRFLGLLYTQKVDLKVLKYLLDNTKPGISEILSHPAKFKISASEKKVFDFQRQNAIAFMKDSNRSVELKALLEPSLKEIIKKNNILLTSYGDLTKKK